ncbi:hypothetical protein WG899_17865 [Paucibacter sp. AS339]|uniref:hypothetical protein n=1 Tax=Paucibacter hankyongi TaxID=3133434 RepID=UPI0030AA796A
MTIATLSIALFICSFATLLYGYFKNHRQIMLAAAIALYLSGVFGDYAHVAMSDAQSGFQAGVKATSAASSPNGAAAEK